MRRTSLLRLAGACAALINVFAARPIAAQDALTGEEGPLRFLRPSVGPEAQIPAPVQADPEAVQPDAAATGSVPAVTGAAESSEAATQPVPPMQAGSAVPERPQPLRLGVLAGRDAAATLNKLSSFAQGLGQALGRPAEILPMSSYRAMIDAQSLARIDGGFYSASAYAFAHSGCQCVEPLVAPAAADGTTAYHSVIVTRGDSNIADLSGLAGQVVAAGGADSIGGRRMPMAALLAEGVEPQAFFAEIRDAGSAEQAVRLVASGDVDAAFAWSSLSGDIATGYSRGTLADLAGRGEIAMSDLALVWRSPAITHGPFAVNSALPDAEKATIEAYLLGLEQSDPAAYDALNPYYSGGYAAVDPEDYGGIAVLAEQDIDAVRAAEPALAQPAPEVGQRPEGN